MSLDLSFLSADPLLYFLAHSTLFVLVVAAIFFTFGLVFGWFTWARYKSQRTELLGECETMKDEIAQLKRKLAEHAARIASLTDAASAITRNANNRHSMPDPVVNSFLQTAAALLPQRARRVEDQPPSTLENPDESSQDVVPPVADFRGSTSENLRSPDDDNVTSRIHPKQNVLQSIATSEGARVLAGQAGDDESPPLSEPAVVIPAESQVEAQPVADEKAAASDVSPLDESRAADEAKLISEPHLGLIYNRRPALSDDLSILRGVASVIEGKLHEYGVYTFKQIALWSDENIREFSNLLAFKDRIRREQWVEQARELHFQKYGERL